MVFPILCCLSFDAMLELPWVIVYEVVASSRYPQTGGCHSRFKIRTLPLWSNKFDSWLCPKGAKHPQIQGSNIPKLCFFIFFQGKCWGSDFGVRQPVIKLRGKTCFFQTHDLPVIDPWFTHDNPWFSSRKIMGSVGPHMNTWRTLLGDFSDSFVRQMRHWIKTGDGKFDSCVTSIEPSINSMWVWFILIASLSQI